MCVCELDIIHSQCSVCVCVRRNENRPQALCVLMYIICVCFGMLVFSGYCIYPCVCFLTKKEARLFTFTLFVLQLT